MSDPTRRAVLLGGTTSLLCLSASASSALPSPVLVLWLDGGVSNDLFDPRTPATPGVAALDERWGERLARVRMSAASPLHACAHPAFWHSRPDQSPWLQQLDPRAPHLRPEDPATTLAAVDDAVASLVGGLGAARIDLPGNWDDHEGDGDEEALHTFLLQVLDHAFAGVASQPTLANALVVLASDVGRSPLKNYKGGRNDVSHSHGLVFGEHVRGGAWLPDLDATELGPALLARSGVAWSEAQVRWATLFV